MGTIGGSLNDHGFLASTQPSQPLVSPELQVRNGTATEVINLTGIFYRQSSSGEHKQNEICPSGISYLYVMLCAMRVCQPTTSSLAQHSCSSIGKNDPLISLGNAGTYTKLLLSRLAELQSAASLNCAQQMCPKLFLPPPILPALPSHFLSLAP